MAGYRGETHEDVDQEADLPKKNWQPEVQPEHSSIHHLRTRHVGVHISDHSDNRAGPWPEHPGLRKGAGCFTKFRLLMWKNFLQQIRHPIQTVAEVVVPVLSMALILIVRKEIDPHWMNDKHYPSIRASDLRFSTRVIDGLEMNKLGLAYSPQGPILDMVMSNAVDELYRKNKRIFDYRSKMTTNPIKLYPHRNNASLGKIYSSEDITRQIIAAVEFPDDFGDMKTNKDIVYKLRFPQRPRLYSFYGQGAYYWHTELIFPRFEKPGPRFPFSWEGGHEPGYVNELFIGIQNAVSMSLIASVSGQNMTNFVVYIQRFPHPAFVIDEAVLALQFLFPMCIMLSFTYSTINIVKAMTVEKELQLKETMKIMGLPTWLYWTAWFVKQFISLLIIAVLIVILIKVHWFQTKSGYTDYAVFSKTSWTVLFAFLLLYLTCTIFFCFMLSNLFKTGKPDPRVGSMAALCSGLFWFMTYAPAILLSMDLEVPEYTQVITCLFINTAMSFGFQMLLAKECVGGMQWGKFLEVGPEPGLTFGDVMIMLAVDSVLYMAIALYLEQVFPGRFGSPRPWYFLVQKNFWFPTKDTIPAGTQASRQKDILVEREVIDHPVGIKLTHLTKVYGKNVAVDDLNLEIYDNQITILLGHNGAGKSTAMSLLTGITLPTRGTVWMGGYDVAKQTAAARAHLGFCPQHNVLFNELTVREHLEFFTRLKGYTGKELRDDIDNMIEKLELTDKRDYQAGNMSGGQKRRLAVGIALCGSPRVVLLDEPTSGMDPSSRRALWDLLQKEKNGRSMILTTHFMDEADLLGDRVAIMANGQLQCIGSPFFLKRFYGVGYTLVVVKEENFNINACTECIKKHIPDIKVKEDRGTEVKYELTYEHSKLFETLLEDLESKKSNIHFKNYGLTATTLEDVFMSVGSDVVVDDTEFEMDITSGNEVVQTRFERWAQHVMGVWLKLWLVLTRSWLMLLLQILVPVLQINLSLGFLSYAMSLKDENEPMIMNFQNYPNTETLVAFKETKSPGYNAAVAYVDMFYSSKLSDVTIVPDYIDNYYLKRGNTQMELMRKKILIGATFFPRAVIAWFSNFGYHDAPMSLAAVHQALLKAWDSNASLTVYNLPLETNYDDQSHLERIVAYLSMQLSFGVASSMAIISAVFVMFYIRERTSGAKLLQKSAGIPPILLWGSAAMFDWTWFLITSLTNMVCCAAYSVIGFTSAVELGRMYFGFMVYSAATLPLHYMMSLFFDGAAMGFVVMYFMNVIFGMTGAQIVEVLYNPLFNTSSTADFMDSILQAFPLYCLSRSVTSLNQIGLKEWSCNHSCVQLSPVLGFNGTCHKPTLCEHNVTACCGHDSPYFEWEYPGILRYLFCMVMSGTVLWVLFLIIEYRIFQKIFHLNKSVSPINWKTLDEDVATEIKRVETLNYVEIGEYSLVAKGLTKKFKNKLAVDQISFTVSEAEVFGLLGVNGAGKTTTFRMLMGDESISSGDAFVAGYSVKNDLHEVHQRIGYCPQFDAVFNELTGRETLRLFSLFRGLRRDQSASRIDILAQALGFTKHLDKRVDQYSGGNKRKLSTAVALLGQTRMVFVDEPTTGVDPAAKRQVWRAVRAARRAGRGIVLTSHSMEECEALCSRLTIMVNGRFQCIGTPQHLKTRFSEGHTLMIKLKKDQDGSTSSDDIDGVKEYVMQNFKNPKIMEEHQTSLTYYLPDTSLAWSKMFGIMERCREKYNVEDYTISQTTLEQIFLKFARQSDVPTV